MKKVYERPMMVCDQFTADEYVATCTDPTYVFKCDANGGNIGIVYKELGDASRNPEAFDDLDFWFGAQTTSYHACNKESHTLTDRSQIDLEKGYVINTDEGVVPVYIWTENNTTIHCTKDLAVKDWVESNKS